MEANSNDRIIEKIRALLNLGKDDAATVHEAENALRFARRLMLKHNVDQKDLDEAKDVHETAADAESIEYGKTQHASQGSTMTKWETTLATAVCQLVGTVQAYFAGKQPRRTPAGIVQLNQFTGKPMIHQTMVFYGPAEDARDAQQLMQEWSLAAMALARMKFGGALRGDGRAYCEGFVDALYEKVMLIKREERALIEAQQAQLALPSGQTRSTALMTLNATNLMVAKQQQARKWLGNQGIKLSASGRSGGRYGSQNANAYGTGKADGRSANFSHSRTKKLGGGK